MASCKIRDRALYPNRDHKDRHCITLYGSLEPIFGVKTDDQFDARGFGLVGDTSKSCDKETLEDNLS